MSEANNGEPPSLPVHPKPKRHNAKRLTLAKRQAIIYALANHESVESIRLNYRASRHTVHAIREQYPQEIEAAQQLIKAAILGRCCELAHKALDKFEGKIERERSWRKQLKIVDAIEARVHSFDTPVQKKPYPMSIKLAALRRASA